MADVTAVLGTSNSKALRELQLDLQDDVDDGAAEVLAENMDEAEKKRLINQLIEHREMKRRGLIDLFERTGIRGIALFTRGNADDPTLPHCVDSDDVMEFFGQNLGIPAVDVLRRFESWSCTLDQGTKNKNDVNSIRKQVSKLVQDGLRKLFSAIVHAWLPDSVVGKIKNNNNLLMEYVNYDIVIREGKGVELAGWPADVPMTRPATMNVETARRIRDQLRTGEIHWVAMTKTQHNELIAEHNAQREAMGAGALRKRALHSDIGTKRGPQKGKKGAKKTAEKMTKESARDEEWVDDDRAMVTTPTPPLTTGRERPALDAVAAGSVLLPVFRQPTALDIPNDKVAKLLAHVQDINMGPDTDLGTVTNSALVLTTRATRPNVTSQSRVLGFFLRQCLLLGGTLHSKLPVSPSICVGDGQADKASRLSCVASTFEGWWLTRVTPQEGRLESCSSVDSRLLVASSASRWGIWACGIFMQGSLGVVWAELEQVSGTRELSYITTVNCIKVFAPNYIFILMFQGGQETIGSLTSDWLSSSAQSKHVVGIRPVSMDIVKKRDKKDGSIVHIFPARMWGVRLVLDIVLAETTANRIVRIFPLDLITCGDFGLVLPGNWIWPLHDHADLDHMSALNVHHSLDLHHSILAAYEAQKRNTCHELILYQAPKAILSPSFRGSIILPMDAGSRRSYSIFLIKKQCIGPADLHDSLAVWIPVPDEDYMSIGESDNNLLDVVDTLPKEDDPNTEWHPMKQFFLDEMIWHHGLGDDVEHSHCSLCNATYDPANPEARMMWLPDRYKQFQQLVQQFAFISRIITGLQECAVICWACPYNGRNLPADWQDVNPKYHTCIAFAALLQKDTRMTTGLRCSGVGGCICTRHECIRPDRISNLQKGERYVNMYFIMAAVLVGFCLLWLTISYDISCQWKKHLAERNAKLLSHMQLRLADIKWQYGLLSGRWGNEGWEKESLSFKPGVGKSDDEGVEHTWAMLNPVTYHTKNMGKGHREDVLEDKINNHNFLKNISQGDALQRKLIVAIAERKRQIDVFMDISETVSKPVKKLWQAGIDQWSADPTKPNPYSLPKNSTEGGDGRGSTWGSPAAGNQCDSIPGGGNAIGRYTRILAELARQTLITADRERKLQERCITFFKKLATFRTLQTTWMQGASHAITEEEGARDADTAPPKAKNCHFISYHNANITGQIQLTKAATIIGQTGHHIDAIIMKYHQSRDALIALKGPEHVPQLRELKPDDIRLDGDAEDTDSATQKKNMPGTSRKVMSWIWIAPGALDDQETLISLQPYYTHWIPTFLVLKL
ncbi:hypothetical protein B0H10DRAFT_1961237 [Mycena sp. CBHHK59/15]|nr:hypothetical protein B0H10DRAFT_1961237 [Mycena sp. CBHHK59/15]